MKKAKRFIKRNAHILILFGVALLCAIFIFAGTRTDSGYITLDGKDATITDTTKKFIEDANDALIEYAENAVPTKIILENGETTINAPTIEYIDGAKLPDSENISDDGKGVYHDTSSYLAYYNSVGIGNCITNAFGAQCFALADDFWQNYAGRKLSSCGTGAAKGTLNCYEYNAGDDFEMVWDATKVQPGDWVVTKGGTYGHIFMAMGYYNNGYIAGFGENQGGGYCPGGGAATNVANINVSTFGGAFRPKTYIKPDPEPINPDDKSQINYTYKPGDYFSKVLVELGLDENNLWGENGTVPYYTEQLIAQNMLDSRGNVFVGKKFTLERRR